MASKPKLIIGVLIGLLVVGVFFLSLGAYGYLNKSEPQAQETPTPNETNSRTPKSASGWISGKQPNYTPCANLPLYKPSVLISSDGLSCTLVIPAAESNGVKAMD